MYRTFNHAGRYWAAEGLGAGASGRFEKTRWAVKFHCLSDPSQPEVHGSISEADPNQVSEEALIAALEESLILDTLTRAGRPLTGAEIASATGITEDAVVQRILKAADRISEAFPPSTPARYEPR